MQHKRQCFEKRQCFSCSNQTGAIYTHGSMFFSEDVTTIPLSDCKYFDGKVAVEVSSDWPFNAEINHFLLIRAVQPARVCPSRVQKVTTWTQADIDRGHLFYQHEGDILQLTITWYAMDFLLEDRSEPPNLSPHLHSLSVTFIPKDTQPPSSSPTASMILHVNSSQVAIIGNGILHFIDDLSEEKDLRLIVRTPPALGALIWANQKSGRDHHREIPHTFSQSALTYGELVYQAPTLPLSSDSKVRIHNVVPVRIILFPWLNCWPHILHCWFWPKPPTVLSVSFSACLLRNWVSTNSFWWNAVELFNFKINRWILQTGQRLARTKRTLYWLHCQLTRIRRALKTRADFICHTKLNLHLTTKHQTTGQPKLGSSHCIRLIPKTIQLLFIAIWTLWESLVKVERNH